MKVGGGGATPSLSFPIPHQHSTCIICYLLSATALSSALIVLLLAVYYKLKQVERNTVSVSILYSIQSAKVIHDELSTLG